METLDQIAISTGTDKSSAIHNYCVKYEKHLPFCRDDRFRMLEIGVAGGSSLAMWARWFRNALITGIDINPHCKRYEADRVKVEIMSQTDVESLKTLSENHGPFDLVIDDGSHMTKDQVWSFKILFPLMNTGGMYVVEDVCCSYWKEFKTNGFSAVDYFTAKVNDVNFLGAYSPNKPFYARREDWLIPAMDFDSSIESILFLNSMIMIQKRK